jgi:hypothetical protein
MPLSKRLSQKRGPEKKDFENTQLKRTNERIARLLKNPNLSEKKRERLMQLMQRMEKAKEKLNKRTLARINRKIEGISGRERIKMMREIITQNYEDIKKGNLSSLPKLFTLLKSDRVPLKYKDVAIYRLKNKLYMKDEAGSYTFDIKANQNKKWEIWYKGDKITEKPSTKRRKLALEGLFDKPGIKKTKEEREAEFHYSEQPVISAEPKQIKEKLKQATEKPGKKLAEDIKKFNATTASSAGPIPKSLIDYAKKLDKESAVLEGDYKKEGKEMGFAVHVRKKEVNGKNYYEFDVQELDKGNNKLTTRFKRYWPTENEAEVEKYFTQETATQVALRQKLKEQVTPKKQTEAKKQKPKQPERVVASPPTSDDTLKDFQTVGTKKETVNPEQYRELLSNEVKGILDGIRSPRELYNKLVEERRSEIDTMSRPQKAKEYQKLAKLVSKFMTTMKNLSQELDKGKLKTVAEMNKRFNDALSILPKKSKQRRLYAKMFENVKKSA